MSKTMHERDQSSIGQYSCLTLNLCGGCPLAKHACTHFDMPLESWLTVLSNEIS